MGDFGSAFRPFPAPAPPAPAPFDPDLLARSIAEAVTAAFASVVLPTPQVNVDAPDLTEIVNAVVGIKGPATATEIADAIAARLRFPEPVDPSGALAAIAEAMGKLEFRMQGMGSQAYGGGSVKLEPGQVVTAVGGSTEATLSALSITADNIRRGLTDYEARLDYDGSNNLIYSGKAANGTATTATAWTIQKLSYTGANLTRVQVLPNIAWDSRVSAPW